MDKKPTTHSRLGRRDWMKRAATLVGGTAAAAAGAEAAAAQAPKAPQTTTSPSAARPAGTRVVTPDAAVVDTTAGKVRGFSRNGVHIFRGIPYGETTGGANRFMPAQRAKPWTGVRSSTSWGPVCPQAVRSGWRNDEEQFLYQWDDGFPGEDMLRVNVWTPAVNDNRRRPVLVWIHGGGFATGSSQELRPYDGARLASGHDVVLVSLNHRLNVFGFLDLSKIGGAPYAASANHGILDVVMALEWVRDNIARFGGDPADVTIFGQSGGARKVSTLMAMPAAKGLFHKAAVLSGSHLRQIVPETSERLARAVLAELNVTASSLGTLQQLPYERILAAAIDTQRRLAQGATPASPAPNWGPVVDGTVLPQHAFDPAAPAISAHVPLMVGNAFVEITGTGMSNPTAHLLTDQGLRDRLAPAYGARAGELAAAYQKAFPQMKPFEIYGVIAGTSSYRINAVIQADLKSAQTAPVYMYWFGWKTPVLDGRPLAYHCQDLAFWFDNIDLAAQATGGTDDARALAAKMSAAFVAFARTGNPAHPGLPKWDRFTAANRAVMVFENDGRSSQRLDPDRDARTLLRSLMNV